MRNTVAFAVTRATEAAEAGESAAVHLVNPVPWQRRGAPEEVEETDRGLLDRAVVWAREDLGLEDGEDPDIELETAVIGENEYLFSPMDYAEVLIDYARANDLDRIVLDPEYQPGARAPLLTPLKAELSLVEGLTYEEAPVERRIRRVRLVQRTAGDRDFWALFLISYAFYLVLGGLASTADVVTGAITAAIVAALLTRIAFERPLSRTSGRVLLRWLIYVPILLWEIAKANIHVAYVVLHPRLPIDPGIVRFRPALRHGLPVTTLANSITLTPGTLTVDVRERDFFVHHLTASSREDLLEGTLERLVRFVFYGRSYARLPSPPEAANGRDRS